LGCFGCRDRVGCAGKCVEEGVALSIDLDAPVAVERVPQHSPMLEEHVCVGLPELVQQPR
jgi:hypothetical protein